MILIELELEVHTQDWFPCFLAQQHIHTQTLRMTYTACPTILYYNRYFSCCMTAKYMYNITLTLSGWPLVGQYVLLSWGKYRILTGSSMTSIHTFTHYFPFITKVVVTGLHLSLVLSLNNINENTCEELNSCHYYGS